MDEGKNLLRIEGVDYVGVDAAAVIILSFVAFVKISHGYRVSHRIFEKCIERLLHRPFTFFVSNLFRNMS